MIDKTRLFHTYSRVLAACLLLALLTACAGGAALAEGGEVRIRVDGAFISIQYGQHPVVVDGRTLVPIRDVMSSLGFTVEWDGETQTVHLGKTGFVIAIPIGSDSIRVNNHAIPLDVPAQLINNRAMVPLRAISESTGMGVYWRGETRTVDIWTAGEPPHTFQHYINWYFTIYREPDFRASRAGSFGPQAVTVLDELSDGWALIHTYRGEYWVYLRANRRYIERPTGLYDYRGAMLPMSSIRPQVVDVLDQEGNWLRIGTWLGPKWIDLEFTPPTQELDQLLGRHGNRLSVYFRNIETGFVYRYNADRVYASASVTKAPFALHIFQMADRGETDLDSRHRFPHGGTLPQREMLHRMLRNSCNASTFALRDVHGIAGYRQFVADLGGNPSWVAPGVMGSRLNLAETARFARAIWDYIESDAEHSDEFKAHLLHNQITFIVSDYPKASKTGWTNTVFHDMSIVYAESPYILIILSQRANRAAFAEISVAFQEFNDTWF